MLIADVAIDICTIDKVIVLRIECVLTYEGGKQTFNGIDNELGGLNFYAETIGHPPQSNFLNGYYFNRIIAWIFLQFVRNKRTYIYC